MIDIFFRHVHILCIGNTIQQKRTLHLGRSRGPLCGAQAIEIEIAHVFCSHSLGGQRPQSPIQPDVDLLLHQRLRNGKLETIDQRVEQPEGGLALHPPLLIVGHVFAQLLLEVRQALVLPQLLGELVVQFRLDFLLDALTSRS